MNRSRPILNLINSCNNLKSFKQIHAHLIKSSTTIQHNLLLTKAIEIFSKSSQLDYTSHFLHSYIDCNTTSFPFNSLISSYGASKTPESSILLYRNFVKDGFSPDTYTVSVILKSCSKLPGSKEGKQFHGVIVKMGLFNDIYVQNGLLHLYSLFGECDHASKLFDEMPESDTVSWNSVISGYVKACCFGEALVIFLKMDVGPNASTIVSALVACGRMSNRGMGKGIHCLIFKRGFAVGLLIGNALLDMYVKCECLDEAKQVFYELKERDAISWTCIISGLVQCKQPKEALEFFHAMEESGMVPDKVTLTSVLSACSSLGVIEYGERVHEYVDSKGIEKDPHIGTALVDMYAKCGSIEMALFTFQEMPHKNIFTWNALLGGLAMHGHGKEALDQFSKMLRAGKMPNEVTFLAILSACCHSGLVDEGCFLFAEMSKVYNLTPRIEHYGCMVDMLCRAGLLSEAWHLIKSMPMVPDVLIWGAMLSVCKAHGDVEMSQTILDHLLQLESNDSGVYVLLSNIFAGNNRWEDVKKVRRLMKVKGIKKFPGSSVIDVDGKTHEFLVGDADHPQQQDIHIVLNIVSRHIFSKEHLYKICDIGV